MIVFISDRFMNPLRRHSERSEESLPGEMQSIRLITSHYPKSGLGNVEILHCVQNDGLSQESGRGLTRMNADFKQRIRIRVYPRSSASP